MGGEWTPPKLEEERDLSVSLDVVEVEEVGAAQMPWPEDDGLGGVPVVAAVG